MREVNEMYLGLNTLRDRFGIGPLIKNHSEGELMWRDGVESGDSLGALPYSRGPAGNIGGLLFMFSMSPTSWGGVLAPVCGEDKKE